MGGVLEGTIDMMETLGALRARIVAVLGPTISRNAYEVGPEYVARFLDDDPANKTFFSDSGKKEHAMFDLPGYIVARLAKAGVQSASDMGACTYADEDRFFSYRRATHRGEPDYGPLLSAIVLTAD